MDSIGKSEEEFSVSNVVLKWRAQFTILITNIILFYFNQAPIL